jgi:glucosamine-6-phosphate deaminase
VRRAVEGEVDLEVARRSSSGTRTPRSTSTRAAADLTRVATPWLLDEVDWTQDLMVRAVVWLSLQTGKGILKLTQADYSDNALSSLVARFGSPGAVNGEVFNILGAKIRGKSKLPQGKKIICFSPHPDDDVISMGGILYKLAQNRNAMTVAYMTSGNIAVFDHEVRRYVDFLLRMDRDRGLGGEALREYAGRVYECLERKQPGRRGHPGGAGHQARDPRERGGERHRGYGPDEGQRALPRPAVLPDRQGAQGPDRPRGRAIVRRLLDELDPDLCSSPAT